MKYFFVLWLVLASVFRVVGENFSHFIPVYLRVVFHHARWDEDRPMEVVTPKGWTPTPMGAAGRRTIKPVTTFTIEVS